ncbi:NTP transferase domain-containing protein [Roseibium litorale]|uniref:Molybdopterin-binding/glycosyltransferase family 2 protein n=1 Tax=Roseibium litorale TaxID=2803841 RepID=A0ABR9CLQ6_9HYPH|nr:molybdopterin-binding/glycosyltransferase family 2 protein [Roseibium litorale]MBD8891782.1 molybdopterin-binding/glycosyltransferase family 2 protein [Roseibium litorale]
MEFGPVPTATAAGCILAHATRAGSAIFKKGRKLSEDDIAVLLEAGVEGLTVGRLSPGDIGEDEAARMIAEAAGGDNLDVDVPFTGRVNLYASASGIFTVDRQAVDAMNRIDPGITIATLPAFEPVDAGRMVATAKIIPFAVGGKQTQTAAEAISGALNVAPYRPRKVGLVATCLPHLKPSTMDKTRQVLGARLSPSGSTLLAEERVPHTESAVSDALSRLHQLGAGFFVLFGASAVVDGDDVLPSGIRRAGGTVEHFGMPVDPGNLLLTGTYKGLPVIGAPGCARSPKENGFDWVLNRLLADIPVTGQDITGMGVGGLLMEISSRPQLRTQSPLQTRKDAPHKADPKVAVVILAAGKSSRMGGPNKLLAHLHGKSLIRTAADAALASKAVKTIVVTGHMAEAIEDELAATAAHLTHNPEFNEGMAGSILAGLGQAGEECDAVLIMLGDMPAIGTDVLNGMISQYAASPGTPIIVATADGKRGNPVLWDKQFFPDLRRLEGDIGARHIIAANPQLVGEYEIGGAARLDLDTPEALEAAGGLFPNVKES